MTLMPGHWCPVMTSHPKHQWLPHVFLDELYGPFGLTETGHDAPTLLKNTITLYLLTLVPQHGRKIAAKSLSRYMCKISVFLYIRQTCLQGCFVFMEYIVCLCMSLIFYYLKIIGSLNGGELHINLMKIWFLT